MRKAIVAVALLLLIIGIILALSIQENRIKEIVIDEWDPITPSTLYPGDVTGWAFMVLTSSGTYLELNISASDDVRIIIGLIFYNETTGEEIWNNVIFSQTGSCFTQKVEIAGKNVNFLEIKNEGTNAVNISGNIRKMGNIRQPLYPYSGLGTLVELLGLSSMIYGILAKPRRRKRSLLRAYEKAPYKVYLPYHNEHTLTHSFIMKGVMGERFPPSHLSVKP